MNDSSFRTRLAVAPSVPEDEPGAPAPCPCLRPILHGRRARLFGVEARPPPEGTPTTSSNRVTAALAAAGSLRLPTTAALCMDFHPQDLLDEALYTPDTELTRNAHRVVFELTHHDALERVPDFEARLAALRSFGYRFTLEHVGAGVGVSKAILHAKPHYLKIDYKLISGATSKGVRDRILRNLVTLCGTIGATPIAVGMGPLTGRGREERRDLARLGCHHHQGRLLAGQVRRYR